MRPFPCYLYSVLTVVLPIIFRLISRKITWASMICAVVIECVVYWDHFCYYESRELMIYLTIIQIVIMIIITVLFNLIGKKKAKKL